MGDDSTRARPNYLAIAFVAPLAIFFVVPELVSYEAAGEIQPRRLIAMISIRLVLMFGAIGFFWTVYRSLFPLRIDGWGVLVGLIGGAIWIAVCSLKLEVRFLELIGLPVELLGARDGVDPYEVYPDASQRTLFVTLRFALLMLAVPVAEELFLRGFLMRFVDATRWEELPLTEIGTTGIVAGSVYGAVTHPGELVAAVIWFSLVSLLMVKTGKFWNCVLAHAITNGVLGVYIMATGTWHLW